MKLVVIILAAAAALAVAAATEADAQTLPSGQLAPEAAALMKAVRSAPPAAVAPITPRYMGDKPVRIRGVAQTAVDAPLGEDVTGSMGFMCGLKPGAEKYGAAAARGYDDTGRFVGAKLRVAFR